MKLTIKEYRLLEWIIRDNIESKKKIPEDEIGRLNLLCDAEYVSVSDIDPDFIAGVTVEGRHAMEEFRDYTIDRRWTRWLAIGAMIISIIAILVQASEWRIQSAGPQSSRPLQVITNHKLGCPCEGREGAAPTDR